MEDILTWAAPALTIVAALMTASNLGTRVTGFGFVVFTVGSLCWLALGQLTDQPNLLWQNVVLTLLNLFGIWRWLGRQRRLEDGAEQAQDDSRHTPGEALFPASLLTRAPVATGADNDAAAVDAMVGCTSGRIAYVVVARGGLGGVGEEYRRLDWADLEPGDDGFALAPGVSLDDRPTVEAGAWPAR